MKKTSKIVSLLLSGLIAASCFTMSLVSASAASVTSGKTALPAQSEDTYVVAGFPSEIFGTAWDASNRDNTLTYVEEGEYAGCYTKEYTVDRAFEGVQFKIVKNGTEWIGDESGNNITFDLIGAGTFSVYYNPDPDYKKGESLVEIYGDNVYFGTDPFLPVVVAGNGEGAWLNGADWIPDFEPNAMTPVAEDVWEITFENVPCGSDRQIRFAIDGGWYHNFGGEFVDSGVVSDAVYYGDIITFDTPEELQNVKIMFDLRDFDFSTKYGAKFSITIEEAEPVGIIGDVDGNDILTVDDATRIQKRGLEMFAFDDNAELLADVDRDGRISILDVTCVQKYIAEYQKGTGNAGDTLLADGTVVPAPVHDPVDDIYIVAGSPAEIFGTAWDASNEDNTLTYVEEGEYAGCYIKEYTVDKTYEGVQLKVVKNGTKWIGDEFGGNITFDIRYAGTFTVCYNPNLKRYRSPVEVYGDAIPWYGPYIFFDTVFVMGNGEGAWLHGADWVADFDANEMTEVAEDVWEISLENVPRGSGRQLKFAPDGVWTNCFGGDFVANGVTTDADYVGESITFDTPEENQTVKIQLDLSEFDFNSKEGAKFTITIIPA